MPPSRFPIALWLALLAFIAPAASAQFPVERLPPVAPAHAPAAPSITEPFFFPSPLGTSPASLPAPDPDASGVAVAMEEHLHHGLSPWAQANRQISRVTENDHDASIWPTLGHRVELAGRSFYVNDHRIEWSGQEATCAAEGVVSGVTRWNHESWQFAAEAEVYVNQPFDRNVLIDTPERESYRGNFEIEPLELSQLCLGARWNDCLVAVGRFATPFGRTYFPVLRNDRSDGPFIRTEAIRWRETGLLLQYDPAGWQFTAAMTNGGDGQDTNSSKALVARIGWGTEDFACGASVKKHDGIGSEGQKQYNNHVGFDAMWRCGPCRLSCEAIRDEYGFRRPGFDPLDITWGRSIYERDRNQGLYDPIVGYGYYVNLDWVGETWTASANYGEYYPEEIGVRLHDITNRRALLKVLYQGLPRIDLFVAGLRENDVDIAQADRTRWGYYVLCGIQCDWGTVR